MSYFRLIAQAPPTLSFQSSLSYISPSGVLPACYYNNPFEPTVFLNGSLVQVSTTHLISNFSGAPLWNTDPYLFGNQTYRNGTNPFYQILPGTDSVKSVWVRTPDDLAQVWEMKLYPSTTQIMNFVPSSLYDNLVLYTNTSSPVSAPSQIDTAVNFLSGAILGSSLLDAALPQGGLLFQYTATLSNQTRLTSDNITIQVTIPTNYSTNNLSEITPKNLSLNYSVSTSSSQYYYYVLSSEYYSLIAKHEANESYILGSGSNHSGLAYTVNFNASGIKLISDVKGVLTLDLPAILIFNLNNSNPSGGYYQNTNISFNETYRPASMHFSYSYLGDVFHVSVPLNLGKTLNVTYDSGSDNVLNTMTLLQNVSYLDTLNSSSDSYSSNFLTWSLNPEALYILKLRSVLNGETWTSNTLINYNGKNYSGTEYIPINAFSASNIKFTAFIFYNTKYLKLNYSLDTNAFNPCDPITAFNYTLINSVTVNGSISGKISGTNSTSNSSSTPTQPTTPTPKMVSALDSALTSWGIFFVSLIVLGMVAFGAALDKGKANETAMMVGMVFFVAINLFGLVTGYGNNYVEGILIIVVALLIFESARHIFGPRGS
jgi:hypothetical protein